MADILAQDNRPAVLATALPADTLVLSRFDGNEAMSELFEFRIEAVSLKSDIDFDLALGKSVTVRLTAADKKQRFFNGLLAEARDIGQSGDLYVYQLVVRPWMHLLSLTADCRVFTDMSAKELVLKVFKLHGFSDVRDETKFGYPMIEYSVQYRETALDFVDRIMEKWGIYYYFEHEDSKHTLVLADEYSSHDPHPPLADVKFVSVTAAGRQEMQHLEEWSRGRVVESGVVTVTDYNYRTAGSDISAMNMEVAPYAHGDMELYDSHGGYRGRDEGDRIGAVRLQSRQSLDARRTGSGSAVSLFPGALVEVRGLSNQGENQQYYVVACGHYYDGQSFRSDGDEGTGYSGSFEFQPVYLPFRAEQVTPWPRISGVTSALVIGKGDIDVDEDCRILVEFKWGRPDDKSRRVRVSMPWAGAGRGGLFIPRVGDEILVSYEDGDPDRPIVTGSVYNSINVVPADLPTQKNITGLLGRSVPGGSGLRNANLFEFDDTESKERVVIRARRNFVLRAWNDELRHIGGSQTEAVDGSKTQTIGGDVKIDVGGPKGGGDWKLHTAKSTTINADQDIVGKAMQNINLEAMEKITIKVGANSITIDQTGITLDALMITIKAPMVSVNATAAFSMTAGAISLTANAAFALTAPVNVITGSAITTMAGGSLILAAPTVAASLTGMTPAGIPII